MGFPSYENNFSCSYSAVRFNSMGFLARINSTAASSIIQSSSSCRSKSNGIRSCTGATEAFACVVRIMCHPALDFEKYIFLCFYTIRKSDGQESHIFDAAHCPERSSCPV